MAGLRQHDPLADVDMLRIGELGVELPDLADELCVIRAKVPQANLPEVVMRLNDDNGSASGFPLWRFRRFEVGPDRHPGLLPWRWGW